MRLSRSDRSVLSDWWFTVDKQLLMAVLALMAAGIVLSLAASPAVALRTGLPSFYYVQRHLGFTLLGAVIAIVVSLLRPRDIRRFSLLLLVAALIGLVLVLLIGPEVKGAQRWLRFAGFQLQPSEFLKPVFVVIVAFLFAEQHQGRGVYALPAAIGLYALIAALLVRQPDMGQTLLLTAVWGALFFLSGKPVKWMLVLLAAVVAGIAAAYSLVPHFRARFLLFFNPDPGGYSQVTRARQSFEQGGWFGRGLGEGTIKTSFPDAHTDFIFSVVAEEYGIIACLLLVGLVAFIVLKVFQRGLAEPDPFIRYASIGLAVLVGLQALINMGVNVGLLPAKGMTLPFISYGGSSMLGASITVGILLALTRRRPLAARSRNPVYLPDEAPAGSN